MFIENGREVRKMPIKLENDQMIWVDVQDDNKTGELNSDGTAIQEDSIMLNLDMEGNGALNITKTGSQGINIAFYPILYLPITNFEIIDFFQVLSTDIL